jgi:hypothetical protein
MTTDLEMTGVDFLDENDQIARFLDRDSHPGTGSEPRNSNGDANGKKIQGD